MITPSRVADVDSGRLVLFEEITDDSEGTSTGESLDGGDSSITNERASEAEEDSLGALSEGVETIDGEVLLVEGGISDDCGLSLADDGEHVRLAIVITVGTDTEVDLLGVLVGLEASGEGKDGISGGLGNVFELVVQSGKSLHVDDIFYYNYSI